MHKPPRFSESLKSQTDGNVAGTYFAPAERSSVKELQTELRYIEDDVIVATLLRAVAGLVAVLNEKREVLALNTEFLKFLGVSDPAAVLGLRLGEIIGCAHAAKPPAGCSTTEYCSTCGAAVAQVTSLTEDRPVERMCAIDLRDPIKGTDHLFFRVQATPLLRGTRRILLLFLQDISAIQERAALDRTFFHDVKNTMCAVLSAAEILAQDTTRPDARLATALVQVAQQLAREIELHRCLSRLPSAELKQDTLEISAAALLKDIAEACAHHPEATGRSLQLDPPPTSPVLLKTDPTLLHRVIQNMVINALEATPEGGFVRLWIETNPDAVQFSVWNAAVIPPDIARRVFQRNFSTKAALGRGLGTYSMKLIGERMLRGQVSFTSESGAGTCFRLVLPIDDQIDTHQGHSPDGRPVSRQR